ncbi:cytochrome P450-dit2 [Allomyces arbusculus]|nr:cytochrome P450-dit2 [Allomyces arbusculus]
MHAQLVEGHMAHVNAVRRELIEPGDPAPTVWAQWMFGHWAAVVSNYQDVELLSRCDDSQVDLVSFRQLGHDLAFDMCPQAAAALSQVHRDLVRGALNSLGPDHTWDATCHSIVAELDHLTHASAATMDRCAILDVGKWANLVAIDLVASNVFGSTFGAVGNAADHLVDAIRTTVHDHWHHTQFNKCIANKIDDGVALVYEDLLLRQHHRNLTALDVPAILRKCVLRVLAEAHITQPTVISRDMMRAQLSSTFIWGVDSTAHALHAVIYLFGLHPDVQDAAAHQVLAVLGDAETCPHAADLARVPFLDHVFREALRLFPPTILLQPRRALQPLSLHDGTVVPSGTWVTCDILQLQRVMCGSAFQPARWAKPYGPAVATWHAFSGGSRACPAQAIASAQVLAVMVTLLRKYQWHVVGNAAALDSRPDSEPGWLKLHLRDVHVVLHRRQLYP